MKKTTIKFHGIEFNVGVPGDYNGVVIYTVVNGIPEITAEGIGLKSTCLSWLEYVEDISGIVDNMEYRAVCSGNDIKYDILSAGKQFDLYVNHISGEELFAEMANGSKHFYIDWSKIKIWNNTLE